MVRAGSRSVVVLIVVACAGKSISTDEGAAGSGGDDTGGSAGMTGGFSGTVTAGGVGGTSTTGGLGGTVAAGGTPSIGGRAAGGRGGITGGGTGATAGRCTLPPDPGPCDAAIRAYAFDAETRLCLPYIFGGCEGNPNHFDTIEECYAVCEDPDGGGPAYCESSAECAPVSTGCCGCTAASLETVVGVNRENLGIIEATKCATVDCEACTVDPAFAWFGASCRSNRCVAWDARAEDLTLCMTDADCQLRNGFGCCEACEARALQLIAVNSSFAPQWVCPDGQPPCPSCPDGDPAYPQNAFAACINSRCAVVLDDP
jgi:hypothetical protein